MSSVTEPVARASRVAEVARGAEASRGAVEWLDALAGGACDQAQFFLGVGDLLQRAPDSGWELLGLVDQYFRRGKISAHLFGSIKTRLQGLLVGRGDSDEVDIPAPQMQDEPPRSDGAPPAAAISLNIPALEREPFPTHICIGIGFFLRTLSERPRMGPST